MLQVPRDFERLPEYRLLLQALQNKVALQHRVVAPVSPSLIKAVATELFMRLQVDLAFLAGSTNRPGVLTAQGRALFEQTVAELFGEDCSAVSVLEESGLLQKCPEPAKGGTPYGEASGQELFCGHFVAAGNEHFSGDYVKREVKGANASARVRQEQAIAKDAMNQGMLLAPETFRDSGGTALTPTESQRAMVVVLTLDRCLKSRPRQKGEYTAGLMADAHAATTGASGEQMREIYNWIANHRENPMLPKSTEQVLARWGEIRGMVS